MVGTVCSVPWEQRPEAPCHATEARNLASGGRVPKCDAAATLSGSRLGRTLLDCFAFTTYRLGALHNVTGTDTHEPLLGRLDQLLNLNPDLGAAGVQELYALAGACSPAHFPTVAARVGQLVTTYLASPQKRVITQVFQEYFQCLENSARRLTEKGELDAPPSQGEPPERSVALVARGVYTPLSWARILNRTRMPEDLTKAAEACRRRSHLVTGVLEYAFTVLHLVDSEAAFNWELAYLGEHKGTLDPDVLRDLLIAWLAQDDVPEAAFEWAALWSDDQSLVDQWSRVCVLADRLLARHALHAWQVQVRPRNSRAAQLKVRLSHGGWDPDRVRDWVQAALVEIGDSVQAFMDVAHGEKEIDREASSPAVLREIRRVESLFVPTLLGTNLLMELPNGVHSFALAFFGLLGKGRQAWDRRLLKLAESAVRRMFLRALRDGRKPIEIIHQLTFGDRSAFMRMLGELNFGTASFDSVRQRERVVRYLSVFYASYREAQLLAAEVARRYRNLMRLLHEDNLARVLSPEHLAEARSSTMVRELSTIAAEARRYLSHRRALDHELEDLVAVETTFMASVRQRRLAMVRQFLLADGAAAGAADA